jgi:hypothetical protein
MLEGGQIFCGSAEGEPRHIHRKVAKSRINPGNIDSERSAAR